MKEELILKLADDCKIVTTHERAARAVARELTFEPGNAFYMPSVETLVGIPAIGELWPGQGGYNGGYFPARGDVKAHHLIVASLKEDLDLAYGGRDKRIAGADDKDDGLKNCQALIASGHEHPAAKFCLDYREDGHADYFLGARRQMLFLAATVPQLFRTDRYYWTSTRASSDHAVGQAFGDGCQVSNGMQVEHLVRPVRRYFINSPI